MAKPKTKESKVQRQNPLINRPIAHAYALVPDPDRRGRFFALHLTDVIAGGVEHLEPNGRSQIAAHGLRRIAKAMEVRHRRREWGQPEPLPKQAKEADKPDPEQVEPVREALP